ncbi:MAG TPA: endonuclease/exonuclease/phosphatase family protein [Chlamydiales bacterium]|nr:endonuclease/exonuclease/phosphatase family protein [Chlamydiales bacterium]
MRAMTYNIHFDDLEDISHLWNERKSWIAYLIEHYQSDLICLQEAYAHQVNDLKILLKDYKFVDEPVDADHLDLPIDPILYNPLKFDMIETGRFFLSDTPEIYSNTWEGKYVRFVRYVKFLEKKTSKTFVFFNTHLDYYSFEARKLGVKLLKSKVLELSQENPFIVGGDFNLFPSMHGEDVYRLLVDKKKMPIFYDSLSCARDVQKKWGSFSGYDVGYEDFSMPDAIFVSQNIAVDFFHILIDQFGGKYPSDHFPILCKIQLPN